MMLGLPRNLLVDGERVAGPVGDLVRGKLFLSVEDDEAGGLLQLDLRLHEPHLASPRAALDHQRADRVHRERPRPANISFVG